MSPRWLNTKRARRRHRGARRRVRGPRRRDQTLFTLGDALQMSTTAERRAQVLARKDKSHAMEINTRAGSRGSAANFEISCPNDKLESRPHGFTSSQRFGVQRTISVGIKRRTGRATLCRLRASVHGNRHSSVRKNACASSYLHFVSEILLYGRPLKQARATAALGVRSASSSANSWSSPRS